MGVLSSSIWVLYQGLIFLAAMEWKNITNLFCFKHAHYKVFIFLGFLSWLTALLFITRFSHWTFLYFVSLIRIVSVICLFWHTLTARDDTCIQQHTWQKRKYFAPKWCHLMLFFAGETSWAFALLLAFATENIRKSTTRALHSSKKFELDL